MPVRVDSNSFGVNHSCFDCDVLSELKDISEDLGADMTDICLSPCEDIWKKFDDFLLTPPQSPPIKLDLVSDLLDFNSIDSLGISDASLLHNADVLHDCMWSGQCAEDTSNTCLNHSANCSANSSAAIRICGVKRPDTPFNQLLSTSPLTMTTAFNDLLSSMSESSNDDIDIHSSMDDEDSNSCGDSSQSSSSSTSFAKVKESLINDHSYGGSLVISHQNNNKTKNSCYETQSLIYPKHKIQSRNKIKCHKINGKKIKIIKANSPQISCNTISETKETGNKECKDRPLVVPTVRIIRNDKHFIKSKPCIEPKDSQKNSKFSTRRKSSSVSSERKVMLAQSHQQFLKNKTNERLPQSDDDMEDMDSSNDKSSKVPPLRRREHNDSERKRRDHLRNAFINLKDQIPKLKSADKRPPRIMILHEATTYVCHLNDKQRYLERTLNAEIEKREKLLKMLSQEIKPESK